MLDALYGGICEGSRLLGGILALVVPLTILFILAGLVVDKIDERARAKR